MGEPWPSEVELPQRGIFPTTMPRYPNLWFLIHTRIPARPRYMYAVRWLVGTLERELGLRDTFVDDVENPTLRQLLSKPREGSDFQARIGPLQFYKDPDDPARSHWHQVHARFYVTPLSRAERTRSGDFFLIPISVHYEVATEDPLHPYSDTCPHCGITGDYERPIDRSSQDYCLEIHDPLGLEFLLYGMIRGQAVADDGGSPIRSLDDLPCVVKEFAPGAGEPKRLATVTFDTRGT